MKVAYLDTFSGISGDMTLGAFVGAGVSFERLREELQKLGLAGFELEARHVVRHGITAVKIDVVVGDRPGGHRHLHHINDVIAKSALSGTVKESATKVFRCLGEAEAKIHNTTIDQVHFHEVGAVDSIVDIVGTCICLELAGVGKVYASPVRLGQGGFVQSDHGMLPTPTPATVEILRDYPTVLTDVAEELTTPTGAAIVKTLSSGTLTLERLRVSSIGYGAGTKDIARIPNLLRVLIGNLEEPFDEDELVAVETNIDDMNAEIYPFVLERLLAGGAHDAFLAPLIMKKGRPGVMLSVLASRSILDEILRIIFAETTTLGVRIQPVERRKVRRVVRTVNSSFGPVKVKVVVVDGTERVSPEFEECRRIAVEKGLPLQEVFKALEKEFRG